MALSPKHEHHARPLPKHPYRDSALFHGALGLVILALAGFGSAGVAKGAAIGLAYFVGATGWSCWRFRGRLSEQALADEVKAADGA